MAKIPDMKKFDINGILSGIKSMINPAANLPEVDGDDPVAVKLAQLQLITNGLISSYEEQLKELGKINHLIGELSAELKIGQEQAKPEAVDTTTNDKAEENKPDDKPVE